MDSQTPNVGVGLDAPFQFQLRAEQLELYVLDVGLTVPARPRYIVIDVAPEPAPLDPAARPRLTLGARTFVNEVGLACLCPPIQPTFERKRDYIVAGCPRREYHIAGDQAIIWDLLRRLEFDQTVEEILAEAPADRVAAMAWLLARLVTIGMVDCTGTGVRAFVHDSTKRGAVITSRGKIEASDYFGLAADRDYREYPDAKRVPLGAEVPAALREFHALTRARRSARGYVGGSIARPDFEAILLTAIGETGSVADGERTVTLRAYPAGGALYAIEVYPLVFDVTDLEPGLYHYQVGDHALESLQTGLTPKFLHDTTLPIQQAYVQGAAAVICLAANFGRFERKYGQNGYRALAAEAGCITQNLCLAATALGLRARPVGGFFDDMLNAALGLDTTQEQFMLAVLLGHA